MNLNSPNLNIMIKACEKASKVIIRDFGELENLQVLKKGPRDFVTKTDKRAEKILIEELQKAKKNYSFITEESGIINNSDKDCFWIIDPIDGTTNFLHGIPHFAISVALKVYREIKSGYAEIIKHVLIADQKKWEPCQNLITLFSFVVYLFTTPAKIAALIPELLQQRESG